MKIGLALGGGAARGFAHIGIIQVLQEAGIQIDCVAGTSIGALVGAGFCSGHFDAFVKTVEKITLTDVPGLLSPTISRQGLFSGKNVVHLINSTLAVETIEELPLPFAAIAVDLLKGTPVTITSGNLAEALRCSISIPVVFTPVEYRDSLYVDGGIVDPVPVEAVRLLGADFVIAVDLFGDIGAAPEGRLAREKYRQGSSFRFSTATDYIRKLLGREAEANRAGEVAGLLEVMERTLAVAQHHATRSRMALHAPDALLCPSLGHVGLFDFHRAKDIAEIGRIHATEQLSAVQAALAGS